MTIKMRTAARTEEKSRSPLKNPAAFDADEDIRTGGRQIAHAEPNGCIRCRRKLGRKKIERPEH